MGYPTPPHPLINLKHWPPLTTLPTPLTHRGKYILKPKKLPMTISWKICLLWPTRFYIIQGDFSIPCHLKKSLCILKRNDLWPFFLGPFGKAPPKNFEFLVRRNIIFHPTDKHPIQTRAVPPQWFVRIYVHFHLPFWWFKVFVYSLKEFWIFLLMLGLCKVLCKLIRLILS